ncbi:MAG: dipeptidase E [Bacteroidetes bacterium MedPE-SWsnd-G2]|nr:MAG: dipeptidase E [Bacteroidetes bacterium MedPE-SWsnd-G2]
MAKMIIASTSTVHGSGYLEYLLPELKHLFGGVKEIVFIPFARPGGISHDEYTAIANKAFQTIGINVKGLHEFENPIHALSEAKGLFTGGGNTFVLLSQLYKQNLITPLKEAILNGTPYLGTSAGSNICGLTVNTTNDMPIVYPPSFKALGVLSFNLNPHYLDPDTNSTHMGETRETRIKEFHAYNNVPVLGLREGSWLDVNGQIITLKGELKARLFKSSNAISELETGTDLTDLK